MKTMLAIAGAGLVIALGGWAYGVVTVGVPLQDPTAAQAAAERANVATSAWVMGGGALTVLAGIVGIAILGLGRLGRPRSRPVAGSNDC